MAGTNNFLYDQDYGNVYPDAQVYFYEEGVTIYDARGAPAQPDRGVFEWHTVAFPDQPDKTWFSARRPYYIPLDWFEAYRPDLIAAGYVPSEPLYEGPCRTGGTVRLVECNTDWAPGEYWFYKIPATSWSTNRQLAFRSPVDRVSSVVDYYIHDDHDENDNFHITWYWTEFLIKAGVTYILTSKGETPRWGGETDFVQVGGYCSNLGQDVYQEAVKVRSQSFYVDSVVQAERSLPLSSVAAVGVAKELELTTVAACKGDRYLPLSSVAAILGETEHEFLARTDVRTNRSLDLSAVAAIETEFSEEFSAVTAIGGDSDEPFSACAAVRGEGTLEFSAVAFVAVDRTDAIMLEMENLWPQEYANESVPNWPSKARHWGRDPLA